MWFSISIELFISCCICFLMLFVSRKLLKKPKINKIFKTTPILSPNAICYWRIIGSPFLVVLYIAFSQSRNMLMMGIIVQIYVFLFASDGLDGIVARSCNMTSKEGENLDPLADKILDLPLFCVFCYIGIIHTITGITLLIILILADLIGQMTRGYLKKQNKNIKALPIGKTKTVVKIFSLIYLYFLDKYAWPDYSTELLFICVILAIWSMLTKIIDFKKN